MRHGAYKKALAAFLFVHLKNIPSFSCQFNFTHQANFNAFEQSAFLSTKTDPFLGTNKVSHLLHLFETKIRRIDSRPLSFLVCFFMCLFTCSVMFRTMPLVGTDKTVKLINNVKSRITMLIY
jgi:hypothetical protein